MIGIRPLLLAGLGAALLSQAQQAPPTFRARVDVVRLDVTVLDKDRRPVADLTQGDFTILVDGVPQPIATFLPVVIPPAAPVTTDWMREVSPDVRSNALGEPRLFAIVMDDATTPTDPFMVAAAKTIATRIVDGMRASDLAAIVFTLDNRHAQDFTNDRALLRAAIDRFSIGIRGNPLASRYSARALADTVTFLRARPTGRSAIMLISASPAGSKEDAADPLDSPLARTADALQDLRSAADAASAGLAARSVAVPIYGFNIAGAVAPNAGGAVRAVEGVRYAERTYTAVDASSANALFLMLAEITGGRAVIETNDPAQAVPAVLDELSAYYAIAYRPSYPVDDARPHPVRVRVDRPGVTVVAADRTRASEPRGRRAVNPSSPLQMAVSDLVPTSALPMSVTAAPFLLNTGAGANAAESGLLATVRVGRPVSGERTRDEIEVLAKVFTPEGKEVTWVRQNATLTLRAAEGDADLDVLMPIVVKPGRYNLRFSAHSVALDQTGSVYTDVSVPDFSKDRLSLSGVLLTASPSAIAAPKAAFAKVVPVVPTSEREFSAGASATAFLRVYQRVKPVAPIDVAIRVVDAQGKDVASKTERLDVDRFVGGSADVTCDLPLKTLPPGSYLLSITATLDAKTSSRRDVRFSVR